MSAPSFRRATLADLPTLLELFPLYYESDHLPYDAARAESAIRLFLSEPAFGRLWLIEDSTVVGYLALTFGFSFEFGGREAFVDELFVRAECRSRGYGSAAIRYALDECAREGLTAVRLEVTGHNPRARDLYRRLGFRDFGRSLLANPIPSDPR
ncbi:MAG: GNAT family N-acetyltransferase [Bdellovibrionales bacterium]|nr:GNAT family N-acetyltransferase [Bdellovibrionales bacterium]